ncbi:NSFL1 cofactor p47-like [Arctopsyche grandis]|uniref:NSFL1 cofactor p47-like n=1 Tax=Arctopsyche grandis TaxID=121162 RepID=UPI00406D69F8
MSSPSERESMAREFCCRTGAPSDRADAALEADNWDLELALYNYFLINGGLGQADKSTSDCSPEVVADDSESESGAGASSSVAIKKKEKMKHNANSKFATLQNLNQENSSDEEEGEAFYAGGSVRSGQQILGPGKNKNDIIADMFKSVREHGGIIMNQEAESSSSRSFSGTGYKLGATPDDTTVVKDPKLEKSKKEAEQVVILRLWQNGFNLDGGELRPYSDPANTQFLDYVRRGEIPPELRRGSEVFLTMEDRRHEEFSKICCGPSKPFYGKGQMLGSPTPVVIGSTAQQPVETGDSEADQKKAQTALNVNENEPTTNIQFRLADGSRISGRFNLTHTISNLREYIVAAVPAYQLQTFILLTTFPNKELTDFNQTVKDAGLMNALVVQRLQ